MGHPSLPAKVFHLACCLPSACVQACLLLVNPSPARLPRCLHRPPACPTSCRASWPPTQPSPGGLLWSSQWRRPAATRRALLQWHLRLRDEGPEPARGSQLGERSQAPGRCLAARKAAAGRAGRLATAAPPFACAQFAACSQPLQVFLDQNSGAGPQRRATLRLVLDGYSGAELWWSVRVYSTARFVCSWLCR